MKPIMVFNHTLHKEMWNWISKNPKKTKQLWIIEKCKTRMISAKDGYILKLHNNCFACVACGRRQNLLFTQDGYKIYCEDICPLDWGEAIICCENNGLYGIYTQMYFDFLSKKHSDIDKMLDEISKVAKEIADRPIKQPKGYELIVI